MLSFLPSSLYVPACFPDNGPLLYPSSVLPLLCPVPVPVPLQMEKLLLPAVDLEQWYQELMAGLGTGRTAASPRSSPPPLPAKASRQLQVTPPSLPPPPVPAPVFSEDRLPVHQPYRVTSDGGGQSRQGNSGPQSLRGAQGSSQAGILALGQLEGSLLSPRVTRLTVQRKGL